MNHTISRVGVVLLGGLLVLGLPWHAQTRAADETPMKVTVGNPRDSVGLTVQVTDATGREVTPAEVQQLLDHADMVIFEVPAPAGAWDDGSDCAEAIETACEYSGSNEVTEVSFNKRKGECRGECGNGRLVYVSCSSP